MCRRSNETLISKVKIISQIHYTYKISKASKKNFVGGTAPSGQ